MGITINHFALQLSVLILIYVSCTQEVVTTNVGLTTSSALNGIGCLPCSRDYVTDSYFENHNSLLDSEFHHFLDQNIGPQDLCQGDVNIIKEIGLSDLSRYLIGEGSHQHLVSMTRFNKKRLVDWKQLDKHFCEMIFIERLPSGIFADPFELQHLVERKVFSAAAVFGDTNLELPSSLSNRSVVEIHMDVGHDVISESYETVVQLPLHARYPPLNASGYAQVDIGEPDIFLRCRPKNLQKETCSWAVGTMYVRTNSVMWQIPCGNEALTGIVSSVTFVSALICSLLVVFSAMCFFGNNDIKKS